MPTLEFLHAYREDGRLTLQFVQPNDETIDEGDEEEVEEDYEDDAQQESDEEKGNDDDG
ncbi:hypothetical protein NC653_023909 [Populus alba x Populus x berolinensis]|nr:hypothetical protein NC653_023909 [Populus alba x Populus x berolinensis]